MIHIINRHCKFSNLSAGKSRPSFFSREKCLINLWKTSIYHITQGTIKYHYLFDGDITGHFLLNHLDKKEIIQLNSGSGAKSFVDSIDYALSLNCDPEDIIYLLEDDYLHRPNWPTIIEEGLSIEDSSWISLYDHGDKYYRCLPVNLKPYYQQYQQYTSEVTYTKSSYWRTACSTTDTFAIKYKNLKKHYGVIAKWSKLAPHSLDHNRGLELNQLGLILWTPLPGYSCHMAPEYMSPMIDWELIQKEYS